MCGVEHLLECLQRAMLCLCGVDEFNCPYVRVCSWNRADLSMEVETDTFASL